MCEKITKLVKQVITDLTYMHECFSKFKKEMLKDILNECKRKTKKRGSKSGGVTCTK